MGSYARTRRLLALMAVGIVAALGLVAQAAFAGSGAGPRPQHRTASGHRIARKRRSARHHRAVHKRRSARRRTLSHRTRAAALAYYEPLGQTFGASEYGVNPTSVTDSVNSYDGALEVSHTDIRVAGIGVPFVLTREYNSRAVALRGSFGPGWSSILDLAVRFSSTGSRAVAYGEDGQQVGFTYNATAKTWTRDPGVRASLTCSGPATKGVAPTTCRLTRFSDGGYWVLSHGRVTNFVTAGGQGLAFTYASNGRIDAVTVDTTATTPLVIHITRNTAGEVTKIATPTRSVSYGYDSAGDLTAVADPAGIVWRMTYGSGHLLETTAAYASTSASSGTNTLTATYASTGRVASVVEEYAGQMHNATFGWIPTTSDPSSGEAHRLDAIDVGGTLKRETYIDIYSKGELVESKTPAGRITTSNWGSDMDLLSTKSALGSTETMTYDSVGDELTDTKTLDSAGDVEKTTYAYDSLHRMTSEHKLITSSLTDVNTYSYNSLNELTSSAASGAGTTTFTYNSKHLLLTSTDPQGDVTTYSYDAAGNLAGQTVKTSSGATPMGKGPLFRYDEAGDKTLSVPPVGNNGSGSYVAADATTTTYNADGQATKIVSPGGATTSTTYAPDGATASSTDSGGNTTTYSWSSVVLTGQQYHGEQKTTVGPLGKTVDLYDPSGNIISSTPPQPSSTASGKPAGVVTDYYNADSQIAESTNGQGVTTTYTRDAAGDVLVSKSRGVTTTATYNLVGWATGTSTTTLSYDASQDSASGTSTKDTTTTATTYDAAGDVLTKTDAAGGKTTYTYVAGDRIGTVVDKAGTTTYAYNTLGGITSVTSPAGHVTTYTYDALGRQTSQKIGSEVWTIAYDADGNPIQTVDPDGRTATYTYDSSNRKTRVIYSWASGDSGANAPGVNWSYNAMGERTSMVDGTHTYFYTYDKLGRLIKQTISVNGCSFNCTTQVFAYNYSTPDQLVETYPDGAQVTYKTDDGGNLLGLSVPAQKDGSPAFKTSSMLPTTMVTQGASNTATMGTSTNATTTMPPTGTLYPDGQLGYVFNQPAAKGSFTSGDAFYTASTVNAANSNNPDPPQGYYSARSDDSGNLMEEHWQALPSTQGATTQVDENYGYNGASPDAFPTESGPAGLRLTSYADYFSYAIGSTKSSTSGNYTYNADGQPTSITATDASGSPPTNGASVQWSLGYGSNGELDQVSTNAPAPSNYGGFGPQFTFDNAGYLFQADVLPPYTTMTDAGMEWFMKYNDAGQLASAQSPNGSESVSFSYDGDGNLSSETDVVNGSTRTINLLWDPRTPTPQLAEADFNGNGVYHERYFWGNGPLGMELDNAGSGGQAYVFHDNQAGTPTMITNTSGKTVAASFYDPYGNMFAGLAPMFAAPVLIGFDGAFTDPATGLDLMGSRWYDPMLGMFMSRPAATAPTTGGPLYTSGANSTTTEGMSDSAGTSPSMPIAPSATSYTFAASDPTGEAQPTGSSLIPAGVGTVFESLKAAAQPIETLYSKVKPFVSGPLSAVVQASYHPLKQYLSSLTQSAPAASESAAGTEGAVEGSVAPEEAALESQAGNDAQEATDAAAFIQDGGSTLDAIKSAAGSVGSVLNFGSAVYSIGSACANYGVGSTQCLGTALTEFLSYGAAATCEAVTAGAGSAVCGVLQSVISTVLPLIISGNGQAFLDSVTFGHNFLSVQNAEVLTAQIFIAAELGPIGAVALLGEVIYANWSAIQSAFETVGNAIYSALETAGNYLLSGFESAAGTIVSGLSTAGSYLSSGLDYLVSQLESLGLDQLGKLFSGLGNDIGSVVSSIGSAVCDFVSDISCWVQSAFTAAPPARGSSARAASGATRQPQVIGLSGLRSLHFWHPPAPVRSARPGSAVRRLLGPGIRPVLTG